MCPIKEWFTNFHNLESGAVVMGNVQPCRTMRIGTIRLKIFDGMVRELKEVSFVSALKKNLIFVGALEVKGYKVTIEDDINEVCTWGYGDSTRGSALQSVLFEGRYN